MYKVKTSKTFAKRIRANAGGLVKIGRVGKRHNLIAAPKRRKASPSLVPLHPSDVKHIRQLMPYQKVCKR